jgi:hypothetical protein
MFYKQTGIGSAELTGSVVGEANNHFAVKHV